MPSPALEVPGGRRGSIGPSTAGTSSLYFAPQCRARGGFTGHLPPGHWKSSCSSQLQAGRQKLDGAGNEGSALSFTRY